jgi:hypothetical protein
MADHDVNPDDNLHNQIFTTNQPWTISIVLQNSDKCGFKAEFPRGLEDRHSACVVRLEAENENPETFTTIAAVQQITATIILELVPQTFKSARQRTRKEERSTSQ